MKIVETLEPRALAAKLERLWTLSAQKIRSLEKTTSPVRSLAHTTD